MVKKTGKKIKILVGGKETEAELAVDACFAITTKEGTDIVVAPVVARNARGKEVVRFKRVADVNQCPGTPKKLNRHAEKLKIGYRELPKALGLLTGARKAAPAKVWGKMVAGVAKKKRAIITQTAQTKPAA